MTAPTATGHCRGWVPGHASSPHDCDLDPGPPMVAGPAGSTTFTTSSGFTPGPWSRVVVTGPRGVGDRAAVWAALTTAWREAGQPLVVVTAGRPAAPDTHAVDWYAAHETCGHILERHIVNPWRHGRHALAIRDLALFEVEPWRVLSFGEDDATVLAKLCAHDVRYMEVPGV